MHTPGKKGIDGLVFQTMVENYHSEFSFLFGATRWPEINLHGPKIQSFIKTDLITVYATVQLDWAISCADNDHKPPLSVIWW